MLFQMGGEMPAKRHELSVSVREGEIVEVLTGFGLAHVLSQDGMCYVVNRKTVGINFEALRIGMRVRCIVTEKFSRVLHASVVV